MTPTTRSQLSIFLLTALFLLAACGGSTTSPSDASDGETPAGDSTRETPSAMEERVDLPVSHDCEIEGEMLEGNQFWARGEGILLAVVADSSTYDPDYGPGHRVLEVYDSRTCERVDRHVLPVNVSPDFPYYLAEITYNNATRLVAIRGFQVVYAYDVVRRELLPVLEPEFANERYGVDAQSGMIRRLELWENYLVGYSQDYGAFAFDLSNAGAPEAVLPAAEYEVAADEYHQLFLLPTDDGVYQGLLPAYDATEDAFAINPLFRDPVDLNPNIPSNVADNRYLVIRLRDEARTPVAIDMLKRQRVMLPDAVAKSSTQEILGWMREEG